MDYRAAAVTLWGEAGAYAHDAYARARPLFPELPEQVPIVIGITAYGACDGLTRGSWEHGPRISIASRAFGRGRRYVDDVVLHEALHAWLILTGQPFRHDSEAWYAAVRRLSPAVLGRDLPAERGRRRSVRVPNPDYVPGGDAPRTLVRKLPIEQSIPHAEIARWPHPFRPAAYDWGEPVPCPTY